MSCRPANVIRARRGERVRYPFAVVDEDGEIQNIIGWAITGGIWWQGDDEDEPSEKIALANAAFEIVDVFPDQAADGEEQDPHGYVVIQPAASLTLPFGRYAFVRKRLVDGAGDPFIADPDYLDVDL